MATLMQASRQWASRPDDERFTSLHNLHAYCEEQRNRSRSHIVSSKRLQARPADEDAVKGLVIAGPSGAAYAPSHWAFGQLATLAQAPAGYLRTLPAPIAADAINYGLQFQRETEDVGILLRRDEDNVTVAAATGPRYGRIYNSEITAPLVDRFGDGVSGDWRVPGEFGRAVNVSKENTTLYASDRDMFVFLADETNRVEIANRRDGRPGSLARGFFLWNSEVGSASIGVAFFLFDYACSNRIVWGAQGFREIKLRHTISAPDRWLEEVTPALLAYQNAGAEPIEATLRAAQEKKVDDLADFLKNRRFAASMKTKLENAFTIDENRPIETVWDVATAMTSYAKTINYQDERVSLEREAGKLLDLVAN